MAGLWSTIGLAVLVYLCMLRCVSIVSTGGAYGSTVCLIIWLANHVIEPHG